MARWARLLAAVTVLTIGTASFLACDLNLEPYVEPSEEGPPIGETTVDAGEGGEAGAEGDGGTTPDPDAGIITRAKRVFVTSQTSTGALGDTTGATARCNQLATAANLDGQFIAWLSNGTSSVLNRITSDGPWALIGPEPQAERIVFPNKASIKATGGPAIAINRTETGAVVTGNVWTGTQANGDPKTGFFDTCDAFKQSSSLYKGMVGSTEKKSGEWTQAGNQGCDAKNRLYCFEL